MIYVIFIYFHLWFTKTSLFSFRKGERPEDGTITGGHVPTINGNNELYITAIDGGINIAVVAPQYVRVLTTTGAIIFNGYITTAADVNLPTQGIYVISGENESQKIFY